MSQEREDLDLRLAAAIPAPPPGLVDRAMRGIAADARARRRRRTAIMAGGVVALAAAAMSLVFVAPRTTKRPLAWRIAGGARLAEGERIDVPADGQARLMLDESRAVRLEGGAAATTEREELRLLHGRARLEGRAVITTPRARVVGISDDAQVELTLDDKENEMLPVKGSLLVAATAGSVLTVAVIHGRAEVRQPTFTSMTTLAAGDRLTLPAPDPTPVAAAKKAEPRQALAHPSPGPWRLGSEPECGCVGDECNHKCDHDVVVEDDDTRVTVDDDGPSLGPANARVTIIEFSDYQCPFCEKALSVVHQLADLYPKDVRIVFKNFPLPSHAGARLAAEGALAAGEQGKYWEMHDVILANQEHLDRAALESYAASVGLDLPRFRAALDDHRFAAKIDADLADGKAIGLQGVPAFVINGRLIMGVRPLDDLEAIVDDELKAR